MAKRFINYVNVAKPDFKTMKQTGITSVYQKVSRLKENSNYYGKVIPTYLPIAKQLGMTYHVWFSAYKNQDNTPIDSRTPEWDETVNQLAQAAKGASNLGANVHLEFDTGDLAASIPKTTEFIKTVSQNVPAGRYFTVALMPHDAHFDNSKAYGQDYAQIGAIPGVDYINTELYRYRYSLGSYKITRADMRSAVLGMQKLAPGKIFPVLQTYSEVRDSDKVTPLPNTELQADINSVLDLVPGVVLFRHGLSNFSR